MEALLCDRLQTSSPTSGYGGASAVRLLIPLASGPTPRPSGLRLLRGAVTHTRREVAGGLQDALFGRGYQALGIQPTSGGIEPDLLHGEELSVVILATVHDDVLNVLVPVSA